MKKLLCILLCLYSVTDCLSQYSNNLWCFGDSAAINFSNVNNPTTFTSSVNSRGSCVSIADSLNQLLFYAFTRATLWGPTTLVYNRNNQLMQNGDSIVGEGWYQELVIVPQNNNIFYLFSISVTGSSGNGLYYSVIDMSQNGGLGAVTQKNVQLDSMQANDGIVTVKHANGRDWWLFFTSYWYSPNNNFHTYLITPNGIDAPFIQSVGTINLGTNLTYFKFSKSGNQFALVNLAGQIDLYDFDRCSGIIMSNTSIWQVDTILPFLFPYYFGCEFSPNGKYLYVSTIDTISRLYQFDLLASNIAASKILIDSFIYPQYCGGQLKLAPDNKIYMSNAYNDSNNFNYPYPDTTYNIYNMNLSVINQPDSPGLACNFTKYSFYLGGNRTYWGLPNNPDYTLGPVAGSACDTLTAIDEIQKLKTHLNFYPNPTATKIYLPYEIKNGETIKIELYNVVGIKLESDNFIEGQSIEVDFSKKTSGFYIATVYLNNNKWFYEKILIIK